MSLPEFILFAVDGSVTSRIMLQSIFAEEYQVSLFDSAESCLAQLATQTPSIILTEVELPGMNGFEFCESVKNHPNDPKCTGDFYFWSQLFGGSFAWL